MTSLHGQYCFQNTPLPISLFSISFKIQTDSNNQQDLFHTCNKRILLDVFLISASNFAIKDAVFWHNFNAELEIFQTTIACICKRLNKRPQYAKYSNVEMP